MGSGHSNPGRGEFGMKVALFSPLNPVKTGISDYVEELLPELARHFELEIFIDPGYQPSSRGLQDQFPIIPFHPDRFSYDGYDAVLYHMGNYYAGHRYVYEALLRFPGVVVLHDFVMQGFYAEQYDETGDYHRYARLQEQYYGEQGRIIAEKIKVRSPVPIWEAPDAVQFPLNEEIISHARGLIVHSDFVRERIQASTSSPVFTIPHHGHVVKSFDNRAIRRNLGLEESQLLICSAGYVGRNKRYDRILAALHQLEDISFHYVIAGEDRGGLLREPLRSDKSAFRVLGHLPLPEMEGIISASDICINLRYPTMGESSGALIRMMGYGKPALVTNFGSYAEFPDYAVLKVDPDIDEVEIIRRFVQSLALDSDFRLSVGREARAYVERECGLARCADLYAQAIRHCLRTEGDPGKKGN